MIRIVKKGNIYPEVGMAKGYGPQGAIAVYACCSENCEYDDDGEPIDDESHWLQTIIVDDEGRTLLAPLHEHLPLLPPYRGECH